MKIRGLENVASAAHRLTRAIIALGAYTGAALSTALACPSIDGVVDRNCDGEAVVVIIGDSLVTGAGDTAQRGGYVGRIARRMPHVEFVNLGVAGLRTLPALSSLRKSFAATGADEQRDALERADIVILDLGRNDRWLFKPAQATFRNLARIRTLIDSEVAAAKDAGPLVVTAVLMLPNRGSQGPWVAELNGYIRRSDRDNAPANLRFDLVSKRLLSPDGIHPTSKGYDALTAALRKYLLGPLQKRILRSLPDSDGDGIFDHFETVRFLTSPTLADTDGDGISDGTEVFVNHTDPLAPGL